MHITSSLVHKCSYCEVYGVTVEAMVGYGTEKREGGIFMRNCLLHSFPRFMYIHMEVLDVANAVHMWLYLNEG